MSRVGFRFGVVFGGFLVGFVLYCLVDWASAVLVELNWIHSAAATENSTRIDSCGNNGLPCAVYAADCSPGQMCSTEVDVPVGEWELYIRAGTDDDSEWSTDSNSQPFTVRLPAGCEWDLDGSGAVTTADFSRFLVEFTAMRFTVADFGRYLRAMGTSCR